MVKLGSVAQIINGDRSSNYPSGDDFRDVGVPFINAGHLQNGKVDYSSMDYISHEKYNQLSGAKIQRNDILLCLRGSLGKYALVTTDGGAPASSIAVIRPNAEKIDSRYLSQIIASSIFQKQIEVDNNGSSQPNLSAKSVSDFVIPLPLLEEQQKIASVLYDMDAKLDLLEKQLAKKKAIKQGAMQELLTGKKRLPGFSGEWKQYHLSEICQLINGRAYSQDELLPSGKYRVLRLGNLFTNGHWYYSDLELPEKQYCAKGDLIYAWSATFGPHIWEGEKVIYHYHIWKVELNALACKEYVYHYLRVDVQMLMNELQGGTMAHLTKDNMEKRTIVMPEYEEQKSIADILTNMEAEIEALEQKLAKYRRVKQGMMQQLLTGKIRLV